MNGPHDMGGVMNYGPVLPELDEPPFHEAWEKRALALTVALGAARQWNLDKSRSVRESLPPLVYLSSSYYEIWIRGLEQLMLETGLVTHDELAAGKPLAPGKTVPVLRADQVAAAMARGSPTERKPAGSAQFAVGQPVRTRQINPSGHTRLPRYTRGRQGRVVAVHGAHIYPDSHASGAGENPQWLYTVEFDARELWGQDTTASTVCVDCWEPYLESVDI